MKRMGEVGMTNDIARWCEATYGKRIEKYIKIESPGIGCCQLPDNFI